MRVKYPKTIPAGSEQFRVKLDSKADGGQFDTDKLLLEIGAKKGVNSSGTYENYLHETGETLAWFLGIRQCNSQGDVFFHADHSQFQVWFALLTRCVLMTRITD